MHIHNAPALLSLRLVLCSLACVCIVAAAAAAAAAASAAAAATGTTSQQQYQSQVLQGMRYKALYNLAPLLGSTQEALETWCAALQHNPSNSKIWEEASILLAHLGHPALAVYATDKALGFMGDSVVLLERLVVLLAAQWDWDAAGQVLLRLVQATDGVHPW